MTKHRACPFCGGRPMAMGGLLENGNLLAWIRCRKCHISQLGYTSDDAAWAAWDKRHRPKVPEA